MRKFASEHDTTRDMLNKLRSLREATNNSNDAIDLQGDELKQEQAKFKDQISPRVDFTVFKIYPNNNNVVFSGNFQDMNGMGFQFSLEESEGLYVNVTNLQLTDEALNRLKKLKGYYKNWANEWANKLATEYKPRQ